MTKLLEAAKAAEQMLRNLASGFLSGDYAQIARQTARNLREAIQEHEAGAPPALLIFLHPTQAAILRAVCEHIEDKGYAPTLKEIADATGRTKGAVIQYHLTRLEEQGYIERVPFKSRTIRVSVRSEQVKDREA